MKTETEPMLQFFTYAHLTPQLAEVSRPFCELAERIGPYPAATEVSASCVRLSSKRLQRNRASVSVASLVVERRLTTRQ